MGSQGQSQSSFVSIKSLNRKVNFVNEEDPIPGTGKLFGSCYWPFRRYEDRKISLDVIRVSSTKTRGAERQTRKTPGGIILCEVPQGFSWPVSRWMNRLESARGRNEAQDLWLLDMIGRIR